MTHAVITLFGPPQVEVDGQPITLGRRKALALLAYLAVTGQRQSRESLTALLWPEASPARARSSLRNALYALNKSPLSPLLVVDAESVTLRSDGGIELDVVRFRHLLAASQTRDYPAADLNAEDVAALTTAVSLYQNEFMAGFTLPDSPAFDEWQFFQANELRDQLTSALQQLLRFHAENGEWRAAIGYARRVVALDPLHEPAQHALMTLYARAGQQTAALRQYELYHAEVASELSLEPSAELQALRDYIRASRPHAPDDALRTPHETPHAPAPSHNLPPESTPLIGRETEVARIAQLLAVPQQRLVTVVGPGGIGKTRLALAVAQQQLTQSRFSDGVYFVGLAPVDEPEAMLSLIAEMVGYRFQTDQRSSTQQLCDYFRQKSLLLVLDNFEHLLIGATFVAELLQQAPRVVILATSRERLNLYEEQLFRLDGLAFPVEPSAEADETYAAANLFGQSARRRRPDFTVAQADRPHVATICRLVEGMPLALELAAAWTDLLSVREIATEIQNTRDFLATDTRNVPSRHRSMRAVFNGSWQRLSDTERHVYAQLSVFRGGFTFAAARSVTGVTLRMLAGLVNQSLLRAHPGAERYDMHELLRQYAAAALEETPMVAASVCDRHAAFFCTFLHERVSDLKGARQLEALAELEVEAENVVAAWQWAAKQRQIAQLLQGLEPLGLFYQWTGRFREGAASCRLALEYLERQSPARDESEPQRLQLLLRLLTWESLFNLIAAKYTHVKQALAQAQSILTDPQLAQHDTVADEAFLLLQQSEAAALTAFSGDALTLNEHSLALYRTIGDDWGIALALDALGVKHQSLGNPQVAVELGQEFLAIYRRLRNPRGIAQAYTSLGLYILFAGDTAASELHLRKSLQLFREMGLRAESRTPLLLLGVNQHFRGQFQTSIDTLEASWAIHRELGMPHAPGSASMGICRSLTELGQYAEARRLAEADLEWYGTLDHTWYIAFALFNLGRVALVEGDTDLALAQLQESADLLLSVDDRPLVPDVLFSLALTHRQRGDRPKAMRAVQQALEIALASPPLNPMRFELPTMALLLLDTGDVERAVELYATAGQVPYIARSRWFDTLAGREIAQAAASLPPEVVAAAMQRGAQRDLLATAQALHAELRRESSQA